MVCSTAEVPKREEIQLLSYRSLCGRMVRTLCSVRVLVERYDVLVRALASQSEGRLFEPVGRSCP